MKSSVLTLLFAGLLLNGISRAAESDPAPPKPAAEPVPIPSESATDPKSSAAVPVQPPPDSAAPSTPRQQTASATSAPTTTPATPTGGGDIDLIGDKPEAAAANAPKPLMEEMKTDEHVSTRATNCYKLLADIKTQVELVSKDLDNNGKEVTRLVKTTDKIAKLINDLADMWSESEDFRDRCGTAKRDALRLNDELSQTPRKWTHVRWGFDDMVNDVRKIRRMAKDLADAEPKPVAVVGKDGKVSYTDAVPPPGDPAIARRDLNKARADAVRAALRRQEEAKKNPNMKASVDD